MDQHFTNLRDILGAFARAMNLIDPEVEAHHERVAYIAYNLADIMELPEREKHLALYSALLHDIGSVVLNSRFTLFDLEVMHGKLAQSSSALLKLLPDSDMISEIVRYSQSPWKVLKEIPCKLRRPWQIDQIIHISDAAALLLDNKKSVLNQVEYISKCLHQADAGEFSPDVLRAFDLLCSREAVWLDVLHRPGLFLEYVPENRYLSLDETIVYTGFMSRIVDFRSPFTAMHSAGVAAVAAELARLIGMSDDECKMMRIAGNLHDIGKLRISNEILEKPGRLTDEEFNIMKEHAYHTYILLKDIEGFDRITEWAAFHHEKLNGNGYPFHIDRASLTLGSRIMAVADIFSAITEDRPYRSGMGRDKAIEVLRSDASGGRISESIVELLISNYDCINNARKEASDAAGRRYRESIRETEAGQQS